MIYKFQRAIFVALLLASSTLAQQHESAPDVVRLRQHVSHLASGKLEGRRTGTPGAEEAAQYVAHQFAAHGFKVAPPTPSGYRSGTTDAGYLRGFPYVAKVEPGKSNAMTLTKRTGETASAPSTLDLRISDDWMPLGFSGNARIENAPVAFAGYGIKDGEANYDDYKNATGRVALAFLGTPDGDNPHGRFTRFNDLRLRASAARAAGVRALVFIARTDNFRDEKLSRIVYDNSSGGDAGLPVIVVSRQVAAQILGFGSATQLSEFEKALQQAMTDASGKPRNLITPTIPDSTTLNISTGVVRTNAPAFNVVGVLEGSDPQLKNEYIVIGAHYDHLGRGGAGSRAEREGEIHHGADDNASGTAALIELARLFSQERARMRRTVVLIGFGGEEEGLIGSSWYANNPVFPLDKTVAMINLDMVGRLKDERLMIGGVGTAAEWRQLIEAVNNELEIKVNAAGASAHASVREGAPVVVSTNGNTVATATPRTRFTLALNEDGYGPSDHSSFYAKRIPVLFFFTGTHDDYHRPSDTAERVNYDGLARVTTFVHEIVRDLQSSDKRLTLTESKAPATQRVTGFRVSLGTVPSYAESNDGMRLEGVREGSPAEKAGLKAGDVIVRLAGRDVRNVYDYTNALAEMKPDEQYEVEIVRGGERLKLKITPAARR